MVTVGGPVKLLTSHLVADQGPVPGGDLRLGETLLHHLEELNRTGELADHGRTLAGRPRGRPGSRRSPVPCSIQIADPWENERFTGTVRASPPVFVRQTRQAQNRREEILEHHRLPDPLAAGD